VPGPSALTSFSPSWDYKQWGGSTAELETLPYARKEPMGAPPAPPGRLWGALILAPEEAEQAGGKPRLTWGCPRGGRRRALWRDARAVVAWALAYRQPLRRVAVRRGPFRAAPVAVGFLAVCLLVSFVWSLPGAGHRLVAACCAYQGWQPGPGGAVRLVAGAFLLRSWYEVVWTVAATVLVTAPFEAWMGSGRMLTTITLGHVVPTIAVAAALAQEHRLGGGGLDVGSSAVIVAAAAGLAVRSRSLPVAGCLIIAQLVAGLVQSRLTTAEHLAAIVVGALATMALSRPSCWRSAPASPRGWVQRWRSRRSLSGAARRTRGRRGSRRGRRARCGQRRGPL